MEVWSSGGWYVEIVMSILVRQKAGDLALSTSFFHGGTQVKTGELDGRNDISPVGFNRGVCIIRGSEAN
jgi:hypothetical protein